MVNFVANFWRQSLKVRARPLIVGQDCQSLVEAEGGRGGGRVEEQSMKVGVTSFL